MNTLIQTLSEPSWQMVGNALAHFLWQGALILLLAVSIARLLRLSRGAARYRLYTGVFILMAACPALTFHYLQSRTVPDLAPLTTPGEATLPAGVVASAAPVSIQEMSAARAGSLTSTSRSRAGWVPLFLLAWIAGVGLMTSRFLLAACGASKLRRSASPLESPRLRAAVSDLCSKLGMKHFNRVFLSEKITQPLALGCLRPVVLLPARAITGLPEEAVLAALAHELAHVRRLDLLVNALQRVVETILFFHPAVWILSRLIRHERELACDDLAVVATGERVAYAEMLESFAREASGPNAFAAAASSKEGRTVLQRVRRVLDRESQIASGRWSLAGSAAVVFAIVVFASFGVHRAYAEEKKEQDNAKALIGKWRNKQAIIEFKPGGKFLILGKGKDGQEKGTWEVNGDMLFVDIPGEGEKGGIFLVEGDKFTVENDEFFRVKHVDRKKVLGEWVGPNMIVTLSENGRITMQEGKAGNYKIEADEIRVELAGEDDVKRSLFHLEGNRLNIDEAGHFERTTTPAVDPESIVGIWKGEEGRVQFLPDGTLFMQANEVKRKNGRFELMGDSLIVSIEGGKTETTSIQFVNDDTVLLNGEERMVRKGSKEKPSKGGKRPDHPHSEVGEAAGELPAPKEHEHEHGTGHEASADELVKSGISNADTAHDHAHGEVSDAAHSAFENPTRILGTWVNEEIAVQFNSKSQVIFAMKVSDSQIQISHGRYLQKGNFLFFVEDDSNDVDEEFLITRKGDKLELKPMSNADPGEKIVLESAASDLADIGKLRLVAWIELAGQKNTPSETAIAAPKESMMSAPASAPVAAAAVAPVDPGTLAPLNEAISELNDGRRSLSRAFGVYGHKHPEVIGMLDEVEFLLERCEEELELLATTGLIDEKNLALLQRRVEIYRAQAQRQIERGMLKAQMRADEARAIEKEKKAELMKLEAMKKADAEEAMRGAETRRAKAEIDQLQQIATTLEMELVRLQETGLSQTHPKVKALRIEADTISKRLNEMIKIADVGEKEKKQEDPKKRPKAPESAVKGN